MADPLELLESFPRSLTGGSPDPGDLRKRGDRRRTQHRAAAVVATATVLAAIATPFALRESDSGSKAPVVGDPTPTVTEEPWSLEDGFPLRRSLPVTELTGAWESDDIHLEACGSSLPDGIGPQRPEVQPVPTERLRDGTRYDGGTYEREIMTFHDAATAQAWADAVVALYESCPSETVNGVQRVHEVKVTPTERGSTTIVTTRSEVGGVKANGFQLDQVFVVDHAVFFTQYLTEDSTKDDSREEAARAQLGVAMIGHSYVEIPNYPENDNLVNNSAEAAEKLQNTSPEFQQFIGATADALHEQEPGCEDAAVGVTVEYVVDDRWAVGGVNECGGYRALWGVTDEGWAELLGGQEAWNCAELRELEVPDGIAGTCVDYGR